MRLDQVALPLAAAVLVAAVSVLGTDLVELSAASDEADLRAQAVGQDAPLTGVITPTVPGPAPVAAATLTLKPVRATPRPAGVSRGAAVPVRSTPVLPSYARRASAPAPSPTSSPTTSGAETVRLAQANIKFDLGSFATDLATVASSEPDFITLNEVASRSDGEIRPPGYTSYRSMEHTYTRETPVLWRTDRWTAVDTGTRWLTTRKVKWGERAVNWVTLRSNETGRTLSVVSAHPAPTTRATQGLLPVFAEGLTAVVGELSAYGPVLVGGDLNAHYTSALYPRDILTAGGLSATYDTFGMPAGGTGDHRGGTIDYLLHTGGLRPTEQSTAELASDHDALFATFALGATG